jgi:hypothetical protein
MKNEFRAGIVAAILIMAVAVLFSVVLNKSQNMVPLFLVPAFLFAGYAVASAGFKVWAVMTVAITVLLTLLYAMP